MNQGSSSPHQQFSSDSDRDDRQNRFLSGGGGELSNGTHRAASQPPQEHSSFYSPSQQHFVPSSLGGGQWTGQQHSSNRLLSPTRLGPGRSSSFSTAGQSNFASAMRERAFDSTFEDDESEFDSPLDYRGRTYSPDLLARSRSQSLANTSLRGTTAGGYYGSFGNNNSNPLNIPAAMQGGPGGSQSRYNSYGGGVARSPINIHGSSPSYQRNDHSNMSPFVRDVGQILLDDGSAFRELWSGVHPPRDENGGGGSGTTSRRHSVSVVQPRRGNIVGFNAPGVPGDGQDDGHGGAGSPFGVGGGMMRGRSGMGGSGLILSDDDLASDLGMLNLNPHGQNNTQGGGSQPSSLPVNAPLSRSPPTQEPQFQGMKLSIPGTMYTGPASEGGGGYESSSPLAQHQQFEVPTERSQELTARFIPGQGIQYVPQGVINQQQQQQQYSVRARAPSYPGGGPLSPISPGGTRHPGPPPQAYFQHPTSPQSPRASHHHSSIADLGKGLPLSSVPSSWPLYIVEFKAGRTDLFYCTDVQLANDIRRGDLVIVEADRGKDLGKVVNDTITVEEVEAFQRQRAAEAERHASLNGTGAPDSPTSPTAGGGQAGVGGAGGGRKEINPKMIYGKAGAVDAQMLVQKAGDEHKALQLCQSKVRQKKLPMEVVDAEYQWDRRKLTFYFVAEKRIDFRELVRELFRLYKTRIWMASLQGPSPAPVPGAADTANGHGPGNGVAPPPPEQQPQQQ